jgi:hypothetical protein
LREKSFAARNGPSQLDPARPRSMQSGSSRLNG